LDSNSSQAIGDLIARRVNIANSETVGR